MTLPLDPTLLLGVRVVTLLGIFAVASYFDWVNREVSDFLWLLGGGVGVVLFFLGPGTGNAVVDGLYVLLGVFVLQHFVPWDDRLSDHPWAVLTFEVSLYIFVILVGVWSYFAVGPTYLVPFYAAIIAVVLCRLLFEAGVLYGGADAKALMMVGVLLPVGPVVPLLFQAGWFVEPASLQSSFFTDIPFAFTMLVDGALLTLFGPIAILGYNLSQGEHRLPRSLHMYPIPTEELPKRFVWLKDPPPASHPKEETTAEDIAVREGQARDLLAKGVRTVWVTPQLPFLIPLAIGAVGGLLVGNVLLWLLSLIP